MMTSLTNGEKFVDEIIDSKNTVHNIQTEHLIYQLSSSSDAKKTADKLKKDVDAIITAIANARKIAYEKKVTSDELKISLAEKKESVKKAQKDLDHTRANVLSTAKKTLELEKEAGKIKTAIEKIKESMQELEPKYFERAQSDLMAALIKLISESEKAQSDLRAAKEIESLSATKLQEAQRDLDKSEAHTNDKINEADRIISNVSMTISHIIKSYEEVTTAAMDLLKSSTTTYSEYAQYDVNEEPTEMTA